MCNFVLPEEKQLSANNRKNRFFPDAGEKLYSKWKAKFEDHPGKKTE